MRKNNGKYLNKKARLPLSVYFSYLLALTLVLSGFTSAKYTSEATGTATATVAKFDVRLVPTSWPSDNKGVMNISETATYTFDVVNYSDVTVSYTLHVTGIPNRTDLTFKLNDETISTAVDKTGQLDVGEKAEYTLVVVSSSEITSNIFRGNLEFVLDATQID